MFIININAQTTTVKIIDFVILPVRDTLQQSDTVMLNVMFKTKNATQANKAVLLFGTSNDASDVKLLEADFTNINDTTFIAYSGITKPVVNYSTSVYVKLTQQQYNTFSNATLYVEDLNGLQTQRLYFQKH